jgi:hypothetical protein
MAAIAPAGFARHDDALDARGAFGQLTLGVPAQALAQLVEIVGVGLRPRGRQHRIGDHVQQVERRAELQRERGGITDGLFRRRTEIGGGEDRGESRIHDRLLQ